MVALKSEASHPRAASESQTQGPCATCSHHALSEIGAFFKREHTVIVPLTVREILDEQIAQKLA